MKILKREPKKKISEEKCFLFKTGGGPHHEFELTPVENSVLEVLGDTRARGLRSDFGGDSGKLIYIH